MANSTIFQIDDGTKEYTIQNNYGEVICKIHIRPGDFSILDRFKEFQDGYGEIVEPLQKIRIKNDGTVEDMDDWDKIKEAEKILKDKLNKLFDTDEIGNIFEHRFPFSTVKGRYFVENVMDTLGKIIEDSIEEEAKLSRKRMSKYLKDDADAGSASE